MATHKYVENNLLSEFNILALHVRGHMKLLELWKTTILAASYSSLGYIVYLLAAYLMYMVTYTTHIRIF